jgi:hypothetical protein
LSSKLLRRGLKFRGIAGAHRDPAAFDGKSFGSREPNALAGASNDRHSSF